MSRKRAGQILILLVVMAVLASAITAALAGTSAQEPISSEQGSQASPPLASPDADAGSRERRPLASEPGEPSAQATVSGSVPLGPQPDEDGYTGEHIPADSASFPPSEEGPQQGPPDWAGLFPEPQPDEDGFYEQDAASVSATFHYVHVAGTALRPRDSSVRWRYGGQGCVYVENTSELLNIHLQLPEGSRTEYLRLYYYDTVAADSHAWLTEYDDGGGTYDVLYVASNGSSGYGTALSNPSGHIVDNVSYSYVLNWRADAAGPGLQLCGLRVAYQLEE